MDQCFNGRPHTHDFIGSKNGLDVQGKKDTKLGGREREESLPEKTA